MESAVLIADHPNRPAHVRKGPLAADEQIKIMIATDAWRPQVNGVVRTLESLARNAEAYGVTLEFLTPYEFRTIAMPTYPEIPLALASPDAIARRIEVIAPRAIHVATEGPIGFLARRYAISRGLRFTTSYHTRFPEYISARAPVPMDFTYGLLRRFHSRAAGTLVSGPTLRGELEQRGFTNLRLWRRGVDTQLFRSGVRREAPWPRPIFLYVGRVAVEKNLDAFLSLDLPGTKLIVGDGPARHSLEAKYPRTRFLGQRSGGELADIYASADVFVFPSRTDTYGLVMLEALAAGVPVAAFPVQGPVDVLAESNCGVLSEDLAVAAMTALSLDREECRLFAASRTAAASARDFLRNLAEALIIPDLSRRLDSVSSR